MATPVKLSDELVSKAQTYAALEHRSVPKQIEYWATLGRLAKENPDLPMSFIEGTLLGLHQIKHGEIDDEPYQFG